MGIVLGDHADRDHVLVPMRKIIQSHTHSQVTQSGLSEALHAAQEAYHASILPAPAQWCK